MGKQGFPIPEGWEAGEKRPYRDRARNAKVNAAKDICSGAKVVGTTLISDGRTLGFSFSGIKVLQEACDQEERTIRRHIQELKKGGYLCEQRRKGTSSIFTLGPKLQGLELLTKEEGEGVRTFLTESADIYDREGADIDVRTNNANMSEELAKFNKEFESDSPHLYLSNGRERSSWRTFKSMDEYGPQPPLSNEKHPRFDGKPPLSPTQVRNILYGNDEVVASC